MYGFQERRIECCPADTAHRLRQWERNLVPRRINQNGPPQNRAAQLRYDPLQTQFSKHAER